MPISAHAAGCQLPGGCLSRRTATSPLDHVLANRIWSHCSVSVQGRLDRKIELPHPNEKARAQIMRIHSRKMRYDKDDVNFEELARSTDDFNGAMMKAICVEAGMIALRRGADIIQHEDFVDGIGAVQMKKKKSLQYYA